MNPFFISLTRKLSSKNISSPSNNKPILSQHNSDIQLETSDNVSSFCTDDSCITNEDNEKDLSHDDEIPGFKPKIIQHQTTQKQPFSLTMARQRIASRQVDLQWLDNCLVEGGCDVKPDVDEDVVYSTDDEVQPINKSTPADIEKVVAPKKRKNDEQEIPDCNTKRQKIDSPIQTNSEDNTNFDRDNIIPEDVGVRHVSKENSTTTAKRERLVK